MRTVPDKASPKGEVFYCNYFRPNFNYIIFNSLIKEAKMLFTRQIITAIFLLSTFCLKGFSQTETEIEKAKEDFKKAKNLRLKAWNMIGKGWNPFKKDLNEAEALFREANKIYPGSPGFKSVVKVNDGEYDYLPFLLIDKFDDIKGANKAWDEAINKITSIDGPIFGFRKIFKGEFIPNLDFLRNVYLVRADVNMTVGDVNLAFRDIEKIISLGYTNDDYKQSVAIANSFPTSIETSFSICQYLAFLSENMQLINLLKTQFQKANDKENVLISDIYLAILTNDIEKSISLIADLEKLNSKQKQNARFFMAWIYASNENSQKSKEYLLQLSKSILVSEKTLSRIKLMNALSDKEFESAIKYANDALKKIRGANQPGNFFIYKLRGDAYLGLNDYSKAKSDYEAALIYKPDYEPALNGLAKLEGRIITERLTDKIPPQIIITEPIASRGIILEAASNEVMIKGMATDPGGLKTVTINGEKVYSQEGGTFWGNVSLKEGLNKISITATDFSGNTAEKTIEIERPANASASNAVPVKEGKNYALLIGCQNYDDSNIPSLEDPIPDAIKLKLILKNSYNFGDDNVFTLFNPERSDFKKQFLEIYEVIQPEDNLVIFYAGHGIWVEKEKKGYWMLTDARLNDVNTWLPNKEVLDMIARVPARHTLLITDACFSGSVFRTRGLNTDMPSAIQKINEKISRVAITSGNDTEVPDKSVFMKYLVKALSENKEKYLTAQKMFINQIIEAVMTETKTEPRYGTLELAGHVGGDFIFTRK